MADRLSSDPSPFAGQTYRHGHNDLIRFVDSPFDDVILRFVTRYVGASDHRPQMRASLTQDDLYALFTFTRRCALRTIRSRDATLVNAALNALSAVDADRVDHRDLMWAADIAVAAFNFIGVDPRPGIASACTLAQVPDLLARLPDTQFRDASLYVYESANAVGLVTRSIAEFDPTGDLVAPGLAIADEFERHNLLTSIEVGQSLPGVWFGQSHRSTEDHVRGTVTVRRTAADFPDHMLVAFLSEFRSARQARRFESRSNAHDARQHANLSIRNGAVLCMMIARSTVTGVAPMETEATLERFRDGIHAAVALET